MGGSREEGHTEQAVSNWARTMGVREQILRSIVRGADVHSRIFKGGM